jgi:hypothetical protein
MINITSILQNEAKLREAIQNSASIKDSLTYLGLRAAGGNYSNFRKYCNLYQIPIPESWARERTKQACIKKRIPLDKILVEGSTFTSRDSIKSRCYAAGLLREVCYICGLGPTWNAQPITLQLDHINGVFNDHRISNLRILCPNCHSQTSTFAGRSKRNKCSCGKTITSKASQCRTCCNGNRVGDTKISWPTKEELLSIVEELGYSGASRNLGVSDNAIRKRLKTH